MKKTITCLAAGLLLSAGVAQAQETFWTGDVTPPAGTIANVLNFDWSSSGSGLAVGMGPYGAVNPQGTTFNFLYQAFLTGFTGPGGAAVTPPAGLNTSYEFTFVANIPEIQVNSVPPTFPQTAAFATNAPGQWAMYYDSAISGGVKSVVDTGVGFNDGQLIASGHFQTGELTSAFTALSATTGTGSFIIHGFVDDYDPAYFTLDQATNLPIFDIRLEGTLNIPPLDSTTVSFFDGNDGFDVTGVNLAEDLLFKVDASHKFSVQVPEPSSFILMGLGLLGAAGIARRRMKG